MVHLPARADREASGAVALSPYARARTGIPVQRFRSFRQRRVGGGYRRAVSPIGRADRDIARVAPGATLEFGVADRDEASGFGHLVEIGDALGLRVAVMHEPCFALERRRRIGIERLVAVKKNVP